MGDEDLQAQGWLPACLTALLAQASTFIPLSAQAFAAEITFIFYLGMVLP